MRLAAGEFRAKCFSILDRVHEGGESVTITKRGKVVARLVPAGDADERPWLRLGHSARWTGDPLAPADLMTSRDRSRSRAPLPRSGAAR